MIGVNCPSGNRGWNYFTYLGKCKGRGRRAQFTQAPSPLPDRTHLATAETTKTKRKTFPGVKPKGQSQAVPDKGDPASSCIFLGGMKES